MGCKKVLAHSSELIRKGVYVLRRPNSNFTLKMFAGLQDDLKGVKRLRRFVIKGIAGSKDEKHFGEIGHVTVTDLLCCKLCIKFV